MPIVKTMIDLLGKHRTGEVRCLYSGKVVRKLRRACQKEGGIVCIDACDNKPIVSVPFATPLSVHLWMMDRSSITFAANSVLEQERFPLEKTFNDMLKICGDGDIITYDDGTQATITPHEDIVTEAFRKQAE